MEMIMNNLLRIAQGRPEFDAPRPVLSVYQKTISVIDSCVKKEQADVAYRYCILALKQMTRSQSLSVFGYLLARSRMLSSK
jgi:hypothetical protein